MTHKYTRIALTTFTRIFWFCHLFSVPIAVREGFGGVVCLKRKKRYDPPIDKH